MTSILRPSSLCALVALTFGCAPVSPAKLPVAQATWVPLNEQALLGSWDLTQVNSQPVPRGIGLSFSSDGIVRGSLTCGNTLFGNYQVFSHRIGFSMTRVTERGCDALALHEAAEKPMLGPFSAYLSPDHRHLYVRGQEALAFTRAKILTESEAIGIVKETVQVGDAEPEAVNVLARAGFACRPLPEGEYGRISPEHSREWTCWVATDRTGAGYMLAYGGLAVDTRGKLMRVGTGSYPVVYRNVRIDAEGRTTVVQDPTQWKRP